MSQPPAQGYSADVDPASSARLIRSKGLAWARRQPMILRAALANDADVEVVAVNDLTDAHTLATLLEWDSIFGHLDGVGVEDGAIILGNRRITVFRPARSGCHPLGRGGRRYRHRVHRSLHGPAA